MITTILALVILVFVAAFLLQEYRHGIERRDLLNRLMAGSFQEYKQGLNQRPPPKAGNFIRSGLKKHLEAVKQDAESN